MIKNHVSSDYLLLMVTRCQYLAKDDSQVLSIIKQKENVLINQCFAFKYINTFFDKYYIQYIKF